MKQKIDKAHAARVHAALRWTDPAPPPDVGPPERYDELSTGYTFNAYSQRVGVACSSRSSHAVGRTDHTTSQRPLALYSTKLRALQALRNAVEQEYAEKLAAIDAQIEQAS